MKIKKYSTGGTTALALQSGLSSVSDDDESEDLMQGRTFIPRMSQAERDSLIEAMRKLMNKKKVKPKKKKEAKTKSTVPPIGEPVDSASQQLFALYGAKIKRKR